MDLVKLLGSRSKDDSLMLDIGANVGGYTEAMLELKGFIHAFEPCPALAQKMKERFSENARVTVFQLGVADRRYTDTGFTVYEAWTLAKANRPHRRGLSKGALEVVGKEPFDIEFTTVDFHVRGQSQVDFMKIDTDGHDFRVLKGAEQTIMRCQPNILLELGYMIDDVGDNIVDFIRYIHERLGYQLFDANGNELKYAEWLSWYPFNTTFDVAMIPKERKLPTL